MSSQRPGLGVGVYTGLIAKCYKVGYRTKICSTGDATKVTFPRTPRRTEIIFWQFLGRLIAMHGRCATRQNVDRGAPCKRPYVLAIANLIARSTCWMLAMCTYTFVAVAGPIADLPHHGMTHHMPGGTCSSSSHSDPKTLKPCTQTTGNRPLSSPAAHAPPDSFLAPSTCPSLHLPLLCSR